MRPGDDDQLLRLYWATRCGIAVIWLWTALTSWLWFPHAVSLQWLSALGLTTNTAQIFAAACLTDLLMGVATLFIGGRKLWQLQSALVLFYSLAIAWRLPGFLLHPFGPVIKNLAVLACLYFMMLMERRRSR